MSTAQMSELSVVASNMPTSWERSGNGSLPASQRSASEWFNTDDFVAAAPGTFGDVGRHTLIGPGTQNFDLSLFKNIPITERTKLEFRSEFFNAFNKPQYNLPIADPTVIRSG